MSIYFIKFKAKKTRKSSENTKESISDVSLDNDIRQFFESTTSESISNLNLSVIVDKTIDPNSSKPPLTGYQLYFKFRLSQLRSQDKTIKFGEAVKIVGKEWSKKINPDLKIVTIKIIL